VSVTAWKESGGPKQTPPAAATKPRVTKHRAPAALLVLTALRGSTHVAARLGSATGNVKYDGTIAKGDSPLALNARRLWVQIDSPENLRIRVRGKLVHVAGLKPRVIIVTRTGWHPA
jgi:hypothetical protein